MKKIFMILAVVLLISLTGCDNEEAPSSSTPFLEGTTGFLISFLEDAPPQEVYDGGIFPFEVVVKLKNDGEWDVAAADTLVWISGIDPVEFSLQDADLIKHPDEDLIGTYKDAEGNLVEGTSTYISFPGFNYQLSGLGNFPLPIKADVCYKYGTNVVSKICIKKDLTDTSERSLCQVTEEKQVFSSRAPLQVISVKESVRGKDSVGITFKIEHKGNGEIFQQGSNCDTTGIMFENKVWIEVNTRVPGTKCTGLNEGTDTTGYITMYSGERTITCTIPAESQTDYEKAIDISLIYDYGEDITTQLLMKHTV